MKKLFTLLIALMLFTIGFAKKTDFKKIDPEQRITQAIISHSGLQDPKTKFLLEKLLVFNPSVAFLPAKEEKQKMDSLIFFGNIDLDLDSLKSSLPKAILSTFSYNHDGLTTEEQFALWDSTTSSWYTLAKVVPTYNESNAITLLTGSVYYMNMWVELLKVEFSYDENGMVSNIGVTYFDPDSFQWNDLMVIVLQHEGEVLTNLLIHLETNLQPGTPTSDLLITLEYNEDSRIACTTLYLSDDDVQIPLQKTEFVYDSNFLTTSFDYSWELDMQTWVVKEKSTFEYDDHDNLVHILLNDKVDSTWVAFGKIGFSYDNDFGFHDLILPYQYVSSFMDTKYSVLFHHMMMKTAFYSLDTLKNDWHMEGEIDYYYSAGDFSSVNEWNGEKTIEVYPNPASDFISFNIENNDTYQLKLFDATGKTIYSRPIKKGDAVMLNGLESGIYFYQLIKDQHKISGKFIKQ